MKYGQEDLYSGEFHNAVQTVVLLSAMAALFGVLGWMVFGLIGIILALIAVGILLLTTPKLTPPVILHMYGARSLSPMETPGLYRIVAELSNRAGLADEPKLYYVPSSVMNAFSVGTKTNSAIALSDGLIRYLTTRELAGVLAHEISHIRNNDLKLHTYADMMSRITSLFSFFGQFLLLLYIPMFFFSGARIPLFFILLLVFAPTLSVLLQLALSRTREFVADATAVHLSRDPKGLASALVKMDNHEKNIWDSFMLRGRNDPHPSILRTHPHTRDRIERLMRLEALNNYESDHSPERIIIPDHIPEVLRPPKRHLLGPWY